MIKLKKHNLKPYKELCNALDKHNKVAYVSATGTGKSYVVGKYIEDNNLADKTIILTPSGVIRENWKIFFPNITVTTYQALLTRDLDITNKELIVCDELHHLGAPEWNNAYKKLIKDYHHKLIGLTATPIRYLDNSRDMVKEEFDGNLIEGYDLATAINLGILPTFNYFSGLFDTPERIDKLIKTAKKKGLTDKLYKTLDIYKSNLSIGSMLKKGLSEESEKQHKVSVFVNKIDEIEKVALIFQREYPNAKHYIIHSKQEFELNKQILKEFENESEMAFLYTVDMLSEGMHIDGVDAVVMLRKTISPIVYMQQLGRCLNSSNAKERVTVIDMVANLASFKTNKQITDTIIDAIQKGITNPEKQILVDDMTIEQFEVLDKIEETLGLHINYWTKEEDAILREKTTNKKLLSKPLMKELLSLLPNRTESAIKQRIYQLKLLTPRYYEKNEDKILKKYYDGTNESIEKCKKHLPDKSEDSIITRLKRLGIYQNKIQKWTEEENTLLKEIYVKSSSDELEKIFKRSYPAITRQALRLNLRRQKRIEDKDIQFIKENYDGTDESVEYCANKLRRSVQKIHKIIEKEKIYKLVSTNWTINKKEQLIENWEGKKLSEIMKMFPTHTLDDIYRQAMKLGLKEK